MINRERKQKLYQKELAAEQSKISFLRHVFNNFPEQSDWFNACLVNHHPAQWERRQLKKFFQMPDNPYASMIKVGLKKQLNDKYQQAFKNVNYQRFGTSSTYITPYKSWVGVYGDFIQIDNKWIVNVELNTDQRVQLVIKLNLPRPIKKNYLFSSDQELICIPIFGCREFYSLSNCYANATVKIRQAQSQSNLLVVYDGQIMTAYEAYRKIQDTYRKQPWYRKWKIEPPDPFETWYKSARKPQSNYQIDRTLTKMLNTPEGKKKILAKSSPTIKNIEDAFNQLWHEELNYPAIQFGETQIMSDN